MQNAKSIIAIALPYNKNYIPPNDDKLRGRISVAAVGTDYHIVLGEIMHRLETEILSEYENVCFADTGPLVDREVAKRCCIGFIGKNHSLINEDMGGMLFLGYILTSANIPPIGVAEKSKCGDCRKCIDACPGGALTDNGFIYEKCISYITQCKGELSEEQMRVMGNRIYGCDVCQTVCPYNTKKDAVVNEDAFPAIEEIMMMSNKAFNEKFKTTAAGWRGKKIIQRNALIALGNMNDERARALAMKYISDERPEIASVAKRAAKNGKFKTF
jgi:epoxyqueuosine reductase